MWRLWITIERNIMKTKKLPLIHPGEVLLEDFMKPLGISPYALAKSLGVPPIRISQIVRGRRAITADTALRLARYFSTSAEVWVGLQGRYDIELEEDQMESQLRRIQPRVALAAA